MRNFPSFLDAYFNYARDGFCPDLFHKWIGYSILAAALERKVSLKQGMIHHVPNIYVMLVSHPAVGKSTAIERGTDLIEELKKSHNQNFRIIPNQVTEPALLDLMKVVEYYSVTPTISLPHSSGYFYASEASASALQNVCGDFVATMTAFYDCPKVFRKKLKGEQFPVEIENACMNLLAGSTFDYLKNLVNEQSVMGGFASRLIYVIAKDRTVPNTKWSPVIQFNPQIRQQLVADLAHINKLAGPMRVTQGFIDRFEKWQPDFYRYLIGLNSPRLESILSRKGTNLIKVAMLISISESDTLELTEYHFDRACAEIDEVTQDNAFVLSQAVQADKTSQAGVSQAILQSLRKSGGRCHAKALKGAVFSAGFESMMIKETLEFMVTSGAIRFAGTDEIELLINPDTYL